MANHAVAEAHKMAIAVKVDVETEAVVVAKVDAAVTEAAEVVKAAAAAVIEAAVVAKAVAETEAAPAVLQVAH